MLIQLLVLSLAGEYPFGGEFRHQSIIAPFVFAALKPSLAWARHGLFITAGLLVAGSFAYGWAVYPWTSVQPTSPEYSQFRAVFPKPENIYGDNTSTIYYYAETHKSKWTLQDRFLVHDQRITVYRTDDGNGYPIRFLRNKRQTWFDLTDPETYQVLAGALRQERLERFRTLAPLAGLEYGRYSVGRTYVFVEFKLRGDVVPLLQDSPR